MFYLWIFVGKFKQYGDVVLDCQEPAVLEIYIHVNNEDIVFILLHRKINS